MIRKIMQTDEDIISTGVHESRRESINDVYDSVALASQIETKDFGLNRDFTLSWTEEPIETWAVKQMIIEDMAESLIYPLDKEQAQEARDMLHKELIYRLTLTRSRNGRTFKLFSKLLGSEPSENAIETKKIGAIAKMFGQKNQKDEVEQSE